MVRYEQNTTRNLIPQPTEVYYSGDYDKKSDAVSAPLADLNRYDH